MPGRDVRGAPLRDCLSRSVSRHRRATVDPPHTAPPSRYQYSSLRVAAAAADTSRRRTPFVARGSHTTRLPAFFFFCSPYSTILACVCVSLVLPHHVRNKRRRRPFGPRAVQHRRRPHLQVRGVTIFTYLFIINRLFAGWRSSTTSWWVVGARIIAISLLISPRAISVVVIVVKRKYVNLAYAVSIF